MFEKFRHMFGKFKAFFRVGRSNGGKAKGRRRIGRISPEKARERVRKLAKEIEELRREKDRLYAKLFLNELDLKRLRRFSDDEKLYGTRVDVLRRAARQNISELEESINEVDKIIEEKRKKVKDLLFPWEEHPDLRALVEKAELAKKREIELSDRGASWDEVKNEIKRIMGLGIEETRKELEKRKRKKDKFLNSS